MDGLITIRSHAGAQETMDRLEAEIKAHGMTVFTRTYGGSLTRAAVVDAPLKDQVSEQF